MAAVEPRECETDGCSSEAKLQCPTCIKLGIQGSYFCSQECFKGSWSTHKLLHKKAKEDKSKDETKSSVENDVNTDPWPGYRYTGKLRPHYPLTPKRPVPDNIQRPDYAEHPLGMSESEQTMKGTSQIKILSPEDIEGMRVVCRLAREVLDIAALMVKPGMTTEEIDHAVHLACTARNCYPRPSTTTTFPSPAARPSTRSSVTASRTGAPCRTEIFSTWTSPFTAMDDLRVPHAVHRRGEARRPYRELGNIIQKHAQASGFSVVRSYCGHGIHKLFHTAPNVPHYAKNKAVGVMKPGHVFTIEPMICEGGWQDETWPDGWTAVTRDGKRSAQFEHTLLVTETGCEILTRRLDDSGRPHFMSQM
ncbi:hypothetical protein ANANG_G00096350 [Anguilla anguilla]|uniref:C6H2-type domain-containing protein n=1 Tax=Anguilla anguilla TaxID=7936 RepID=A0A9D3MFW2_ANGAN|nr:hypothetical protein ANANG_G00096350 [Anguilla anguilla]